MKKILGLVLAAAAVGPAMAQVGVSIGINEPGVYGRVNIGPVPAPGLIAPAPVIIRPARVAPPPVYLYVPLEQQQHWARYCGRYNACGAPVYFVRDEWVRERYVAEHPGWVAHDRRVDRRVDRREERHEDRHD